MDYSEEVSWRDWTREQSEKLVLEKRNLYSVVYSGSEKFDEPG